MTGGFIALAGFACADVVGDKTSETRESEVTGEGVKGAATAVMTGKGSIVIQMEEGEAESVIRREVNPTMLEEEVVVGGIGV